MEQREGRGRKGRIQRDRNEGKPRRTRFVNELYMEQSRGTLISDNRAEERLSVLINNSELSSNLNPFNKKTEREIGISIINYLAMFCAFLKENARGEKMMNIYSMRYISSSTFIPNSFQKCAVHDSRPSREFLFPRRKYFSRTYVLFRSFLGYRSVYLRRDDTRATMPGTSRPWENIGFIEVITTTRRGHIRGRGSLPNI